MPKREATRPEAEMVTAVHASLQLEVSSLHERLELEFGHLDVVLIVHRNVENGPGSDDVGCVTTMYSASKNPEFDLEHVVEQAQEILFSGDSGVRYTPPRKA